MATRQLSGEDASLTHASLATIVGTGLVLGVVHVLTGPDHLSALAAMTTGSSWRAFSLGMRWGVGHSLGLVIMALIFFAAGRTIDLNHVGVYLNYVVGAFMIALGVWTARQVKRKYREKTKAIAAAAAGSSRGECGGPSSRPLEPMVVERQASRGSSHRSSEASQSAMQIVVETKPSESGLASPTTAPYHLVQGDDASDAKVELVVHAAPSAPPRSVHSGDRANDDDAQLLMHRHKTPRCCENVSFSSPTAQRITALLVGIVHGIAGPGGILGVLPAVVMADWAKSTAYLASFCLSSIFIMGVFAALYGEITGRLGRNSILVEFRLGVFSAAFSVVVGVGWIILQATGYMDKVFE